jgi:adenylate cyclase
MTPKAIWDSLSLKNKSLYSRLSIIFALFFLFPVLAFAYFAYKYNILSDELSPLLALALLIASFLGYTIIRKIFDDIRATSHNMSKTITREMKITVPESATNELQRITHSFQTLQEELFNSFHRLDRRISQISVLKELSDLCYVTFDPEDLFHVTLERALKLVNADIGSVMILEQPKREAFIVQAGIGLGKILNKSDRVDFASSIAKYAVINKSPLLVEDIETDIRFQRFNRPQYGTKSFLCMPLKGSRDVIGVLNLSRRGTDLPFTQDDVDVLTPLLSSASFSYDNLRLMKKNDLHDQHVNVLDSMQNIMSSSLRNGELINTLLKEIQLDVPFDVAMILMENENNPAHLNLVNFLTVHSSLLSRQTNYTFSGSLFEQVIKQGNIILADDPAQWIHPIEEALLLKQHLTSCLLCPLKVNGMIKGVLAIGSMQSHTFADVQEQTERLASFIAQAKEMNRLAASVVKRDQQMAMVKQIGSLLAASTFDMQEVLKHTMDLIRATLEVDAGCLLLLDNDELVFHVTFNSDNKVNTESLRTIRLKLGQGIAGYCAARGEPMIVPDVRESKQFSPEYDRLTGFTTRSVLCVPLISQGRVIGVIEVINKRGEEFNNNDLQLLHSIATTMSIAMENARLYQETLSMAEQERGIRNMFQKFVPKEIVDKITHTANGAKPVINELKTLTFMNIDIRGFSLLSRALGPQKTVAILNHFFSIMGEIVINHGGIVDKYLGDGFLALFGAPVSGINDADHAVAAALEMKAAIGSVNNHFAGSLDKPLAIGIGVHTGEAVIGNIGFEKKMDYTVIGDSVNVVFRLQDLTKTLPNGILISDNTLRALSTTRPLVREMGCCNDGQVLSELKIYELMGWGK